MSTTESRDMDTPSKLVAFVAAQDAVYNQVLSELAAERKETHWMRPELRHSQGRLQRLLRVERERRLHRVKSEPACGLQNFALRLVPNRVALRIVDEIMSGPGQPGENAKAIAIEPLFVAHSFCQPRLVNHRSVASQLPLGKSFRKQRRHIGLPVGGFDGEHDLPNQVHVALHCRIVSERPAKSNLAAADRRWSRVLSFLPHPK